MKKVKLTALFLVAVLLCAAIAGCSQPAGQPSSTASIGGGTTSSTTAPAQPQPQEIIELTQILWDRGTIPSTQGTLEDNWWTRYMDEKLAPIGAKLSYVIIPRAQEAELLSTMLAANNAPDLSKTGNDSLFKTYVMGGGVADMTPYIDAFGDSIRELFSETQLKECMIGGKIYSLPFLRNGITIRTNFIRKDWLDAIGAEIPGTPDEFYEVLKAIKAQDPGGVGSALVPFGMMGQKFSTWDLSVMPAFVTEDPTPEKMLTPFPMWPEAKDTLGYLNMLYNEGLLTDDFILDKDESMFRQKITRGEMFSFNASAHYPYHSAYGYLHDKLRETQPEAELLRIDPFKPTADAPHVEYWEGNPMFSYKWFVPASSKHAELAVKVLNFMSSKEGYMVGCLGFEGEDYTYVDSVPTPVDAQSYTERIPWIEPQYGSLALPFPNPADKELFLLNYIKDFNPDYHQTIKDTAIFMSDLEFYVPTISLETPVSDKVTPALNNFWENEIAKIIMAPAANFEQVFDTAIAEYKSLGGDAKTEELIAAFHEQTGN